MIETMKVLVWQWSRLGGPPRFGVLLARALNAQPGVSAALSLSTRAQLSPAMMAESELLVDTYTSLPGFLARAMRAPFDLRRLVPRVRAIKPDVAVCAQPGPLDLLMAGALRRLGIPFVVLVHDAELHPGDGMPLQMPLQRALCRSAAAVGALTGHVAAALTAQGLAGTPRRPLIRVSHPPLAFDMPPPASRTPGPRRLLCFGRLLAYKGLDLLHDALRALGPREDLVVRVVGTGPETPVLEALRALPNVTVENRWVPEEEVGALLDWSDALILPYREASQSGVAAAALAAGRSVIATRVGGLVEQLGDKAGALMCEPEGGSVAEAIRALLAEPPALLPAADAGAAWNEMAATLVEQIGPVMRRRAAHHLPTLSPSARVP
ncbi:MAG: glycosyltransferase family 4 protein [Rhodospirillales bacterium]|nr:glycosyltransferase family 4 protein [Rhodospirillales bacterium]